MKRSRILLGAWIVASALSTSYAAPPPTSRPAARLSIPYVATHHDVVKDMLWMANVGKDDVVYDLGSGDGRIVIAAVRDFGARRAVGIEKDPQRIRESRENAQKAGVADRVEFIQADLFASDFREATVVTLFLGHRANIELRPKLLATLRPGARVLSHQFAMGEWEPDKAMTVRTVFLGMYGEGIGPFSDRREVPSYTGNESHHGTSDKVAMWVVPAPVAGIWRGKVETAQGPQDLRIVLRQSLSMLTAEFQLSGPTGLNGGDIADLWGNHVRCWCRLGTGQLEVRFDGRVEGDTMKGTLAMIDNGQVQERPWEAKRERVDLTGTWEWPCASGPGSVRLRIDRQDGRLVATYQSIPITDFYDWGGGFYFTLLIGGGKYGLEMTKDNGWLIISGMLDGGELKGAMAFHACKDAVTGKYEPPAVRHRWEPHRIKP